MLDQSGERTRLACWRARPRDRELFTISLTQIRSAYRSAQRYGFSVLTNLIGAVQQYNSSSLRTIASLIDLVLGRSFEIDCTEIRIRRRSHHGFEKPLFAGSGSISGDSISSTTATFGQVSTN